MNTIQLLEVTINLNKEKISSLHLKLPNIISVIEKNEYINLIEDLQSDNEDYIKSIKILKMEE